MDVLNFVDGEFVCSAQANTFVQERPFNDKTVNVVNSSSLDLVKSIQGANAAFNIWKDSSINDRELLLDKIINYLKSHKNKFAELEAWDQGLSFEFSLKANVDVAIRLLNNLKTQLHKRLISEDVEVLPVGIVGVVLSWNLSTRLMVENVIPAILAGNAVIVKLSSYSPVTAQLWGELFKDIGLVPGLVQMLHSQDEGFRKLLITHPGIKALIFTGRLENTNEVIKAVAQMTTQSHKKIQIHSGSKNSAIVMSDLDEQTMTDVLDSFLQGQGQLCWNSARLYILEKHEKLWTDFVAYKLQNIKPSEGVFDSSSWTPVVKPKSRDQFSKLTLQAQNDQAKIISADTTVKLKNFVKPFFTKDMSNCSVLQQDQVHGPAFIISTVKYGFDIPKYSNVSYYGHSASIWTPSDKTSKVIQSLDVGLVSLNKWSIYLAEAVCGVKQSSFGNTNRQIFGDFFSNVKKVL